mmetsp:Transcript_30329/g.65358  ORF Transcript_30329/g.65358 Transcript_30329/m.65358 type:complete len:88 (+) Transcript_30329:214-477(+)
MRKNAREPGWKGSSPTLELRHRFDSSFGLEASSEAEAPWLRLLDARGFCHPDHGYSLCIRASEGALAMDQAEHSYFASALEDGHDDA